VTPHLLVVDDDPAIRRILTLVLEDEGYEVETAADGLEALSKVEEAPPDLLLLDLRLPRMDGIDLLMRVGELPVTPPSIVVSALDNRHLARAAGAADFVRKPFDFEVLLDSVASVLDAAERGEGP